MLNRVTGPRLAGLTVFAVALWAQTGALTGVFYDDGVYVALARALAAGDGYVNGHLPTAFAGVHYPPLYAWALSLLWRLWPVFPDNVALFEVFDAGCLGCAAWAIAAHARRLPLPPLARVPLVTAGLIAFPVLAIVGVRFSEPLFLALAGAALVLGERADRRRWVALAAGGLAGLAFLTRSIGVAVAVGVVAGYLARRSPRQAVVAAAGAALLAVPWVAWVAVRGGEVPAVLEANYGTYGAELAQAGLGALATPHALAVFAPLARVLLPPAPAAAWYPLAATLGLLTLWGAVVAWRRAPALVATFAAYGLVTALWPYHPDRFVWIVLPWVLLLLALGIRAAWQAAPRLRPAVAALALTVIATATVREAQSLATRRFTESAELISVPFRLLTAVIAQETPPEAVVAGADEALLALYTGRRAVPAHLFRWEGRATRDLDPAETLAALCEMRADYIAVTGPGDGAERLVAGLEPHFRVREGPALYRLTCPP